jgi:hypothetical protein
MLSVICLIADVQLVHHAWLSVLLQYGDLRTVKPSDNRLFPDNNGSIIAVSYEARKHGVKR